MLKNLFKKKGVEDKIPEIVVSDTPGSVNDCYMRLRDNIIYHSDNGKNKIYQVESAISSEGKSTVVANLAVSLARSGKKVLVVELDFRKPVAHKTFKITNLNGIVEYMLDECSAADVIKNTEYGVDLLNRGKIAHNTSLIFMSDKFKSLITGLRDKYDVILLDCPPVLQVSDYIHISKISDSVIFVVSSGKVRRSQIKEAISLLNRENVNMFGSVFTIDDVKKTQNGYYGGYYSEK